MVKKSFSLHLFRIMYIFASTPKNLYIMELEVKYSVAFFPTEKIENLGFIKKYSTHQVDKYYIVDKLLQGKRTYLRVRNDLLTNISSLDLHQILSELATDEMEVELMTDDKRQNVERILDIIGYPILCIVDKMRDVYEKDNIKIILDTVKGLGKFIEIEIIDNETLENRNKILDISNSLSLNDEMKVENKGYPDLLLESKL